MKGVEERNWVKRVGESSSMVSLQAYFVVGWEGVLVGWGLKGKGGEKGRGTGMAAALVRVAESKVVKRSVSCMLTISS